MRLRVQGVGFTVLGSGWTVGAAGAGVLSMAVTCATCDTCDTCAEAVGCNGIGRGACFPEFRI